MGASNYECEHCGKKFPKAKVLRSHVIAFHLPTKGKTGLICAVCKNGFLRGDAFEYHIADKHDVVVDKEIVNFKSHDEFMAWKRVIECQQCAHFMTRSGNQTATRRIYYFRCNRSGNVVSIKEEERKRCLKVNGSRKTNYYCPARMTASVFEDGSVSVEFTKTHFGHDIEVKHLKKALITDLHAVLPKTTYPMRQLRVRHKLALSIKDDSYILDVGVNRWGVVHEGELFNVVWTAKTCSDCILPCHLCKTCAHVFKCSCRAYEIKKYMCEHAHLVSLHVGPDYVGPATDQVVEAAEPETVNKVEAKTVDSQQVKEMIFDDFRGLLDRCQTFRETVIVKEFVNKTSNDIKKKEMEKYDSYCYPDKEILPETVNKTVDSQQVKEMIFDDFRGLLDRCQTFRETVIVKEIVNKTSDDIKKKEMEKYDSYCYPDKEIELETVNKTVDSQQVKKMIFEDFRGLLDRCQTFRETVIVKDIVNKTSNEMKKKEMEKYGSCPDKEMD